MVAIYRLHTERTSQGIFSTSSLKPRDLVCVCLYFNVGNHTTYFVKENKISKYSALIPRGLANQRAS